MSRTAAIRIVFIPASFAALLCYWRAFPPSEPIASANGVYQNACCGSLKLENGRMSFQRQQMSYVVEHDKIGRYVLPATYVGVRDGRSIFNDATKDALKLRLATGPAPLTIELWDSQTTYEFHRLH